MCTTHTYTHLSLYILQIRPLSDIKIANVFFRYVSYFHSNHSVFCWGKVFNFIIIFLLDAFVVIFKNSPPNPRSLRFSPVLSSWKFIALHFTFRSMIHFKIIFCKIWSKFRVRCEVCDKVCIFAYVCQMVQHHLLKELLYLHQNAFAPLLKTNWPIYM